MSIEHVSASEVAGIRFEPAAAPGVGFTLFQIHDCPSKNLRLWLASMQFRGVLYSAGTNILTYESPTSMGINDIGFILPGDDDCDAPPPGTAVVYVLDDYAHMPEECFFPLFKRVLEAAIAASELQNKDYVHASWWAELKKNVARIAT